MSTTSNKPHILDTIIATKKKEMVEAKAKISYAEIEKLALARTVPGDFKGALANSDFSNIKLIAEVKKASPSKGVIQPDFDHLRIAKFYADHGAHCISVLTDKDYFMGAPEYLQEIVLNVNVPCLRKDFTIDEYQILEARAWGASAILLIVDCLTDAELVRFRTFAEELGLSVLVETHRKEEVLRALDTGATLIGVNNRNLRTFEISLETTFELRPLVPDNCIFISESGISTSEDVKRLLDAKVHGMLVGESLMRSQGSLIQSLI